MLTLIEREEVSRGLAAKRSFSSIARILKRSPSTISREVHRDGGRNAYRAAHFVHLTVHLRHIPHKVSKRPLNPT
ncbi:helix-turn-helix domain-containing protein [Roseibium marinum]|uniref:helix-turn-helix domain-containing protein n=1 Tax=Roseibium marinum TaxID=281252 RepID=UPI00147603DB